LFFLGFLFLEFLGDGGGIGGGDGVLL